jgi:phage minor structural protein
MIRVYDATEKLFNHNGKKILHPLFAEITKVDNGDYYIDLEDVLDNREYYEKGMIIYTNTAWDAEGRGQGFRCDNPIIQNNRVSCRAWHLSYDSENYIIANESAVEKNCNDAINHYNDNTDARSPFTVISDIGTLKTTTMAKTSLFGAFTELLNAYGGHWVRDNFNFAIKANIGQDRGVVLAYNKNITDIKVEEKWDNVCTKILPFVKVGDDEITLENTYLETSDILYDIPYTKVVEFKYEEKEGVVTPSSKEAWQEWLEDKASNYLAENKYPKVNYSVSAKIDNISDIGDVIHIKHPKLNSKMEIPTSVISVKYDAIRNKYTSIEFGNFKREFKNLVTEVASVVETDIDVKNAESNALLKAELNEATAEINSVLSASYVINNGNEILILDRLPKEDAVYCLKINSAGIGLSNNGINGTFNSAWTIDGTFNMQAVNVINLTASLIKGGTLKLGGVSNSSGTFELYDNSNRLTALMDRGGLTVYAQNGDFVKLNAEVGFAGFNKDGIKIYWADGDVFRMKNAEVENEIKIAGKIKIVPVSTADNVGVGFVAIN